MSSVRCIFMGRHFTQIDGTTVCGPESASVTDIYGVVFINYKTEQNIIKDDEDWKRYRADTFSISLRTCKEREIDKTKWINKNIVKDKIKFTTECSQDEMVFQIQKSQQHQQQTKKLLSQQLCILKKRTLTSISAQTHAILKIKPKIYPLEWLRE